LPVTVIPSRENQMRVIDWGKKKIVPVAIALSAVGLGGAVAVTAAPAVGSVVAGPAYIYHG
jgi:hypothetical protein